MTAYANLWNAVSASQSAGGDATSVEKEATDHVIAVIARNSGAIGLEQARTALIATANTLNGLGNACQPCQQKLTDAAAVLE